MTTRRILFAVFCFLLVCSAGAVYVQGRMRLLTPSLNTMSAFYRDYTPNPALVPLSYHPDSETAGTTASAGRSFVTNERDAQMNFALEPEKASSIVPTLAGDMIARLTRDGAKILSNSGDGTREIHLTYRLGQNLGYATITSSITDKTDSHFQSNGQMVPPPTGTRYMVATVDLREKWYPNLTDVLRAQP